MSTSFLKSFLGGAVLLTAPAALADSTTTIPAFDAKIATARGSSSPGGTTINRAEMTDAVNTFLYDDGIVDAAERAYLGTKVSNTTFLTGVTATAKKYLTDFHELNDGATVAAPLYLSWLQGTPAELYGASGSLANVSEIVEGYVPNGQGVANQLTLTTGAYETFRVESVNNFQPITVRELVAQLSARMENGTASADEVDGAVALITQISRNSNRLYLGTWFCSTCGGGPGDMGGYIVAAVSTDRRFVRMVKVRNWVE
ncbi:hypothetical protein ACLESO_25135 [Pyxidicoccus sp. 3LG]